MKERENSFEIYGIPARRCAWRVAVLSARNLWSSCCGGCGHFGVWNSARTPTLRTCETRPRPWAMPPVAATACGSKHSMRRSTALTQLVSLAKL